MTSKWLEILLTIPDEAVDLASQALIELGSTGITAAEEKLDTFVAPDPEKLKNAPTLKAYFEPPEQLDQLLKSISEALQKLAVLYPDLTQPRISYQFIDSKDWANDWKQHFPPLEVGEQLVICPSWDNQQPTDGRTVLTLDPGQAFGTGTHATTSLCLQAIAEHLSSILPPRSVLDVGTGSGILAMAAAALGAEEVLANDIDPVACEVANLNISSNDLEDTIAITAAPLEELPGRYDLVLANILAAENIRLATELVKHMKPGGRLVLSGILIEQEQKVIDGFARHPLELLSTNHKDEWTCIVYKSHE